MSTVLRLTSKGFERFQEELENNQRLVRMMWLIVVIVMLYLALGLSDWNGELSQRNARLTAELSRTSKIESPEVWSERMAEESQIRDSLTRKCWSAPSQGLASADMQTALQQLMTSHNLVNSRLTLSAPESYSLDLGEFWLIRAQLRGRVERGTVPVLAHALIDPVRYFQIEALHYIENRSGVLELTLSACFSKEG